jgi:regulator of cell morphogenesis and NO signaling
MGRHLTAERRFEHFQFSIHRSARHLVAEGVPFRSIRHPKEKTMSPTKQKTSSSDKTIGEIVADDYRTAGVFEKHGIDFCCGGKVALGATCKARGIDMSVLEKELAAATSKPAERRENYAAWELPFLADYIVNVHHTYLKENTGKIAAYARKIAAVHGAHHPEVFEIAAIFDKIAIDMAAHLREEEDVFFPAVKRADTIRRTGATPATQDIETIKTSLKKLSYEHEEIGDAVHKIRALANGYAIPGDVCNTFMLTYQKLGDFEDDLHKHVHLENNILFLRAAQL